MITEKFSESDQAASARSLYVALAELASDHGSETFTATKALIAHKAGVSVSTVQRLLKGLEQLGVVHIKSGLINGALKSANTYTLLAIGHSDSTMSHRRSGSNPDKVIKLIKNKKKSELITQGNSVPSPSSNGKVKSVFCSEGYQNQPAQSHVKWTEFAAWCRSKRDKRGNPGTPTEPGFWKWLCGQKPQWRNKVRQNFDEEGYVLDGKFFTAAEAQRLGIQNHTLIEKFKPAIKRDGKILC